MKSVQELRKIIAVGAVALLLLPGLCGCAVSAGGAELPAPSKPTVVAPSNTQTVRSVTGAGGVGAKRLSSIKPVAQPIALPVAQPVAAAPVKAQVINVLDIQGTVTVVSVGTEMPAYDGMRLSAGDKLTTGDNSRATLDLNNGGMVLVETNSALEITQSTAEYIEVSLLSGNIINDIEKGAGKYAVKANNVTMGVLGTVFRVKLNGGIAKVDLYEGQVSVTLAGDGGEEHSYDLAEGMSFEGTDETIKNSMEEGALKTGELDLTGLPDDVLNWIIRSLEERENTVSNSEMLKKLINALRQENNRRLRNAYPAVPTEVSPVEFLPAAPAPVQPNLVWGDASMAGADSDEHSLALSWRVDNSTTPWGCGIHWSYDGWNATETEENTDSFYTYDGIKYYISTYTGWGTGNFTVTASNLNGAFEAPDAAIGPLTLNVILIPREFDKDASHVFDHNTVVVNNMTPTIVTSEADETVTATVTPPTDEIDDYRTDETEDPVIIPVDGSSTVIPEDIAGETVYPEGEENGIAIDSVAGDTITVDVYLPTEVLSETDTDPDEPGEA